MTQTKATFERWPCLIFIRINIPHSGQSSQLFLDEGVDALARYAWPGNVRQLRHVVERLVVGAGSKRILSSSDVADVMSEIRRFETTTENPLAYHEGDSVDEFLSRALLALYNQFRAAAGNHAEVARILRVDRNSLNKRVERARRILRVS
jgi:transcriptional regulator with PAS, ATPase and Fis domain